MTQKAKAYVWRTESLSEINRYGNMTVMGHWQYS